MSSLRISTNISDQAMAYSRSGSASRICLASGLTGSMANQSFITLTELQAALKLSLAEAYASERDERFWGRALVAAKFTKATCNVILDVMAEWVPNKAATSMIRDASDFAQKRVEEDAYGLAKMGVKQAAKAHGEDTKVAADEILKRIDLVKDGIDGKLNARRLAKYLVDESLFVAEIVLKELNKPAGVRIVKTTKILNSYAFDLYELVEQAQSNESLTKGSSSAVKTTIAQMQRIEAKIVELKSQLETCEIPQMQTLLKPKP